MISNITVGSLRQHHSQQVAVSPQRTASDINQVGSWQNRQNPTTAACYLMSTNKAWTNNIPGVYL